MRILMTSSGGVIKGMEGWYEHGLAKELVKRGHEVTAYSSSSVLKKHDAKSNETINGINVKRFNPFLPGSLFHMMKNDWDVIHEHHLGYLAPISSYAALRKKLRPIPSVFNVTGLYHDPFLVRDVNDPFSGHVHRDVQRRFPIAKPWKIAEWFVHLPLFNSDKVIAMTKWEMKELEKFGIPNNRLCSIPIGIDLDKYKKKKKDFFEEMSIDGEILLFVGQPTKRKGWEYFLEAMPHITRKFPDAKAVFIGYRSSKELEETIRRLGIEKSVILMGHLPEEKKIAAFQSADIFAFPTLYEGFGMVFLEAMAAGLPIITTDVAGNKEVVENSKNGMLVRPKDEKIFAKSAIQILQNRGMRNKISRNNLQKVKKYEWRIIGKEYVEVYEDAINSKKGARHDFSSN